MTVSEDSLSAWEADGGKTSSAAVRSDRLFTRQLMSAGPAGGSRDLTTEL